MPDTAADGSATIREIIRATWQFAAIRAFVSVGGPGQLRDGPLPVAELASRCGAHAPTLARVLRSVAGTGLLRSSGSGGYELTAAGQALLGGRELFSIRFNLDPEIAAALDELTETIRTGRQPFLQRNASLYDYLATHPETSEAFDGLMVADHGALAARLAGADELDDVATVVDVGGGNGTFLAAILSAHPGMRGTLLELERAVPAARQYLAARGVGDRSEVVAGDFFASVPAGADAYLLCHIIHNWDDDRAVRILSAVRAAAGAGRAKVMLVEAILPDDDSPHYGKDLDMRLLTLHSGRERSGPEYSALLTAAGFAPGQITDLAFGNCLITASQPLR